MLRERRQSQRSHVAQLETNTRTLAGRSGPPGDAQINKDLLNEDVRVSQ